MSLRIAGIPNWALPRDSLAACAAEGKIYTSGGSEVGKDLFSICICALKPSVYIGFYI